jgi:hypothetical protein
VENDDDPSQSQYSLSQKGYLSNVSVRSIMQQNNKKRHKKSVLIIQSFHLKLIGDGHGRTDLENSVGRLTLVMQCERILP